MSEACRCGAGLGSLVIFSVGHFNSFVFEGHEISKEKGKNVSGVM